MSYVEVEYALSERHEVMVDRHGSRHHMQFVRGKTTKKLTVLGKEELLHAAKTLQSPLELVEWVAEHGKLPTPNFSAKPMRDFWASGLQREPPRMKSGFFAWRSRSAKRLIS